MKVNPSDYFILFPAGAGGNFLDYILQPQKVNTVHSDNEYMGWKRCGHHISEWKRISVLYIIIVPEKYSLYIKLLMSLKHMLKHTFVDGESDIWFKNKKFGITNEVLDCYRTNFKKIGNSNYTWWLSVNKITEDIFNTNLITRYINESIESSMGWTNCDVQRINNYKDNTYNTIRLNYEDLIVHQKQTNTIFDTHRELIKDYHEKNLTFIKNFDKMYGTNFKQYIPE